MIRAISLGGSPSIMASRYLGAICSEQGERSKVIGALEKYLNLAPNAKDLEQVQAIIKQLREQPESQKD